MSETKPARAHPRAGRRRTQAAGFDEHMVKPIQIEQVRAVINALTDKKSLQHDTAESERAPLE